MAEQAAHDEHDDEPARPPRLMTRPPTTGYGVGQIAVPLVVTPLLRHGYHQALLVGAVVVVLAGAGAAEGRRVLALAV
jgi:hypothetical protein